MIFIRSLALVGFGVSAYLVWMKLTGQITSVVGCGGEGGCSNVLGSQWSQWFLIPVSAVSACFYLGVIVLTYKLSKSTLTIAAFLLIMAAAWFMGLQVFVIKSFCPWCF
ncbi:vitamin K epoxide reductase family protein, partial [Akkermansiaceae bacterium]|nr:vitamin K epoxide reductase family protein [Akkermansiaceae bacterium]